MESWRPIPGFETRYEVSDLGRVRSLVQKKSGRTRKVPMMRKLCPGKHGYLQIGLTPGFKQRQQTYLVHRLVLEAFVGPCPNGMEASHLNGKRLDNRLSNLQYESRDENHQRKNEHGTQHRGGQVYNAKLDEYKVKAIRAAVEVGVPLQRMAEWFDVDPSTVAKVVKGKSWGHVQ